jgi:hypothetical protein
MIVDTRMDMDPETKPVREGWMGAARLLHERGEGVLLDPPTPTNFDETEWEW